jgi:hypothetical protein
MTACLGSTLMLPRMLLKQYEKDINIRELPRALLQGKAKIATPPSSL